MSDKARVLVVVEDAALGELLLDALADAGHAAVLAFGLAELCATVEESDFGAAIVDLDIRARNGAELLAALHTKSPRTAVIALIPCGGLPAALARPLHAALEKPARLRALLAALAGVPA